MLPLLPPGGGPLIHEVRTLDEPVPSPAIGCAMQADRLETCRDHRCPHRQRWGAAEDRARRDARHGLSHRRNGNER